jgi:peptide/nickel transport system substrate-binding protein
MFTSRTSKLKQAISRGATIGIVVVVVIIIAVGGYVALTLPKSSNTTSTSSVSNTSSNTSSQSGTTSSQSSSSSSTQLLSCTGAAPSYPRGTGAPIANYLELGPVSGVSKSVTPSGTLTDESPGASYDSLDPGVGFFVTDGYFANVFQGLVQFPYNQTAGLSEFHVSTVHVDSLHVVPSLASSWSVSSNYEQYNFTMRSGTHFSNGDPINATTAWFSFVRELYMNNPDGVGISNYAQLTENTTNPCDETPSANQLPDGLWAAVVNGAGVANNENAVIAFLNNMLSNFNPSNATQMAVMSYPNQAYVVVNSTEFQINLIQPYALFMLDLPPQWGAIVDPAYIDNPTATAGQTNCAPTCVTNNTSPAVFTANGMIGSGPYAFDSVVKNVAPAAGNGALLLDASTNYWVTSALNATLNAALMDPNVAQINMEFGVLPNTQISDFASAKTSGAAVIAAPPIAQFSEALSTYAGSGASAAQQSADFSQIYLSAGYPLCDLANGINTQAPWTNNTLLRQAMVHSVNYSDIQQSLYSYTLPNGTSVPVSELFMPPVPPGWGALDNPDNLSLYSYNITLAQQLVIQAGQQGGFYTTLANGTKLGDTSGVALPALEYAYILPSTSETQTMIGILTNGLANIGVSISATGITESTFEADETTPQTGPPIVGVGWCADFPDPIYQQFYDMATTVTHQPNWENNATLTALLTKIPFETNATQQLADTKQAYQIFYQQASILQVPNAVTYFWHETNVNNIVYSPFQFAIYYNMISVS